MNSRNNRKFISWGNAPKKRSEKTYGEVKTNIGAPSQYRTSPKKRSKVLDMARSLGLYGKHIGSKPLHKIAKRVKGVMKEVNMYRAFTKAVAKAQENLKSQENAGQAEISSNV